MPAKKNRYDKILAPDLAVIAGQNWDNTSELKLIRDALKKRETLASKNLAEKIRGRLSEIYGSSKCPRCGGEQVFKTGPHGPFRSCARYPRCPGK